MQVIKFWAKSGAAGSPDDVEYMRFDNFVSKKDIY